jgi:hypothetical protein
MLEVLEKYDLSVNQSKNVITVFHVNKDNDLCVDPAAGSSLLQYLGFVFDGKNVFVRSQSMARYMRRMKKRINLASKSARKHKAKKINKQSLFEDYSHLGKRNFIRYCLRAAKIMSSPTIRRQAGKQWKQLGRLIERAEAGLCSAFTDIR